MRINRLSPEQYKRMPALQIGYGFCDTPFGEGLVAWCDQGVCFVGFAAEGRKKALEEIAHRWKGAVCKEDVARAKGLAGVIFDPARKGHDGLTLLLKGTSFQLAVWEELLKIPFGQTTSYTNVARQAGRPQAVRAAGTAVGRNDLSYLVPCHRVVRGDGSPGGYYWGLPCKRAILDWERSNA